MDSIKRLINSTIGVALQLTGVAYKVQQDGKLSDDKLKMISQLTDNISTNMEDAKKEIVLIENNLKDKNKRIEYLSKENAIHKRKLCEARLEVDELSSTCKKLKEDLTSNQEAFNAVSFVEDFDQNTSTDVQESQEFQGAENSQVPHTSDSKDAKNSEPPEKSQPQRVREGVSDDSDSVKKSDSQHDLFCDH